MTPTQRSLAHLRKTWPLVAVVERFNIYAKVRHDLFGFIDILCCGPDGLLAVQTTSGANVASRMAKIRDTPAAAIWLAWPTRKIVVHGWAKKGPRGARKLWTLREVEIIPTDVRNTTDADCMKKILPFVGQAVC